MAVQQRLAAAGFYRGRIDGVIGSGTRAAIRAYQRANGLPGNGRIDTRLLARMGLR
ncbi:MAG: peptidoglycan-binding protein [Chthoniobacterales bacterium]|nr:peptidoglycan-binding protein [Chthoniobacterales bacterium]